MTVSNAAKLKFCLGIVLYNPSLEELEKISSYAQSGLFGQVLVFDNSATSNERFMPPQVLYWFEGKNQALSIPYNKMIDYSSQHQFDFLCLLDQDSIYPIEEIQKMESYKGPRIRGWRSPYRRMPSLS